MSGAGDRPKGGQAGAEEEGTDAAARTAFDLLGGQARVRELVDRFYDLMQLETRFAALRALHPQDLEGSRDKLHAFLCGWLGGPPLYEMQYGHPRLRARHLPYPIASRERDDWLLCMAQAMHDIGVDEPLFDRLLHAFHGTADWMRNRPDT